MNKELVKNLRDLGFNEREALIYIALVERVECTAYELAQTLSLPRTTIYQFLEKMRQRGIVLVARKNKVRHYSAESFSRLKELVEIREKALNLVLPQLQELTLGARLREPTSHVYLGLAATKAVWEDMLHVYAVKKIVQTYVVVAPVVFSVYGDYLIDWVERRRKLSVCTMFVVPESARNKWPIAVRDDKEKARFLADEYLYPGEITVYGNKTAIFSFDKKQPYVIVIDSPEIAEIFIRNFKLMWRVAKP